MNTDLYYSTFGVWDDSIHLHPEQQERIERSQKLHRFKKIDRNSDAGIYAGSEPVPYQVTLDSCTCPDFQHRGLPCKHMYGLAHKLGKFRVKKKGIAQTWQFWVGLLCALTAVTLLFAIFAPNKEGPAVAIIGAILYGVPAVLFFRSAKRHIIDPPEEARINGT